MKLATAFDEFSLLQRRRGGGDPIGTASLSALREFLVDYSGFEDTSQVTPQDLFTFLLEYFPSEEEASAEVALALLETAAAWSLWLAERGERGLARFLALREPLRADLPRVLEALGLLNAHTRRDDLEPPVELLDEEEEAPRGAIGSGVNRVARLDEADFSAAETEYWIVQAAAPGELRLQTAAREALGEAPAAPVRVPEAASGLLRAGDIIHAEIAPGTSGWELLEVFGVRPGGYE